MLTHTNIEAGPLAGVANDRGHRGPMALGPSASPELIERHVAEARRLRAEMSARAVRRLILALGAALANGRAALRARGPLAHGVAALVDRYRRFRARQRILAALGPRDDHLLADIGLEGNKLSERVAAMVAEERSRREEDKRWRAIEVQVREELMAYSDRELDEIGISRVDIPRIAQSREKTQIDRVRARATAANTNADLAQAAAEDRRA